MKNEWVPSSQKEVLQVGKHYRQEEAGDFFLPPVALAALLFFVCGLESVLRAPYGSEVCYFDA